MKRFFLTLVSLFSLAFLSAQTFAQQRLGLMPDRFTLRGEGQTYEAEAFCLDRHLVLTAKPVPYGQVLAGQAGAHVRVGNDPPISLQEAISKGIISIKGRGVANSERFRSELSMTFVSHDPRPISVEFAEPLAFGQKQSWVNPDALKPLRQPRSAYAPTLRQDMIWRADTYQRQLQVLGYYKGDSREVNPAALRAAARDFQRARALPETGDFDAGTKRALDEAAAKLREDFARIGVGAPPRENTTVQDVTDVVRRYEEYLGRPLERQTGVMSPELRARMAADEATLKQVSDVATLGRAPASDLADPNTVPSVVTFQLYRDGADVIAKGDRGPELWRYFNGKLLRRSTGRLAIREFDDLSLRGAANNSTEGLYVLQTGVYDPAGKVRVAFGPGPVLELTPAELSRFIDGTASIPALDERVTRLTAGVAKRPRVLISRSALNQGRGGDAGGGLPPLAGSGFEQIDPLRLKAAWERRYGDKLDVSFANDINLGLYNIERQPVVNSGSQIRVYVDRTNFKDYGTVATLKPDLRDAGIEVVQAREAVPGRPGVVIITAQKNAQSRAYLEQLAGEGRFKDSILALASCGSGCDEIPFNSKLINKSGARGVLFYEENIHPEAVKLTMLKFCELMSKRGVTDGSFQRLLRQSVEELLADPTTPMRDEVRKLLNAHIQVSGLRAGGSGGADE